MGRRGGGKHASIPIAQVVATATDLDDTGADGRPLDDRGAVVVGIDPELDVRGEQLDELLVKDPRGPVVRAIEPFVVEAGRRDDADPGAARQLGELLGVTTRVARHRIDGCLESRRGGCTDLVGHAIHIGQVEFGFECRRSTRVDDQVLVGVRDPQLGGLDVARDGPNERHLPVIPRRIRCPAAATTRHRP